VHPDKVRNLMVMAAPIQFQVDRGLLHKWSGNKAFDPEAVVQVLGNAPADFLNSGFLMLDPLQNGYLKYYHLIMNLDDPKFVDNFMRMEKWIGDGIEIPGRFYVELIKEGYQENRLVKGQLSIEDKMVNLKDIGMPLMIIIGRDDHLVPKESTLGLAGCVSSKDVTIAEFPAGHIGVSVGGKAHKEMWPRIADWLAERSEPLKSGGAGKGAGGAGRASGKRKR
jgi:polyhydroxyalkanoate synthase